MGAFLKIEIDRYLRYISVKQHLKHKEIFSYTPWLIYTMIMLKKTKKNNLKNDDR